MLQTLKELFQKNPHLFWMSISICVVCFAAFSYLIIDYSRRRRIKKKKINTNNYEGSKKEFNTDSSANAHQLDNIENPIGKDHVSDITPVITSNEIINAESNKYESSRELSVFDDQEANYDKQAPLLWAEDEYITQTLPIGLTLEEEESVSDKVESNVTSLFEGIGQDMRKKVKIAEEESETVSIEYNQVYTTSKKDEHLTSISFQDKRESEIIFIGYEPNELFAQPDPWSYPYVVMPNANCVVRVPRNHGVRLRGYLEEGFQRAMISEFPGFTISGNHCLPTSANSRPYEPDISIVNRQNNLNLFIDVEIDEPYGAIKRTPIHCINEDKLRDAYFTDRGWIVIRFAEIQVKREPDNCLAFIARVIKSVYPNYSMPYDLQELPNPMQFPQWTALEAQKMATINAREQYLGIDSFGQRVLLQDGQAILLDDLDLKTEQQVQTSFVTIPETRTTYKLNEQNAHQRDNRIKFIQENHIYLIDGVHARSVTELIDTCFPIFDEDYWSEYKAARLQCSKEELLEQWRAKAEQARELGTQLHECIEKHYHGEQFTPSPEFSYFLNFHNDHKTIKPYRTEWRIFDEFHLVAGTIDLICKNEGNTFDIYDWKRSEKVVNEYGQVKAVNSFGSGLGPFSHLDDTSYWKYALQQNVYRYILDKHYDTSVANMYLVVMHPSLKDYHKVPVPILNDEVEHLITNCY